MELNRLAGNSVEISFRLRCFLRREEGVWVAVCPRLEVASQGETEEEAKAALHEAVTLWVESCLERETLPQAMREAGFQRAAPGAPAPPDAETLTVAQAREEEILGHGFPLEITVPAYQAAAFLSGSPC